MTHAILDGMHRRMLDASNPDMLAFHEAFADIVAIFQHFTLPGLLLDQIQRTRGNLRSNSLLAQAGRRNSRGPQARETPCVTRSASSTRATPAPRSRRRSDGPSSRTTRGAILVAAVFDAFVRMYENRVADLRRIATGGTGVLPEGDIHPDLAARFAEEAVRLSQRVLNMCIRAIDYLPPVDVTFGDFLRALITADADFFPDDPSATGSRSSRRSAIAASIRSTFARWPKTRCAGIRSTGGLEEHREHACRRRPSCRRWRPPTIRRAWRGALGTVIAGDDHRQRSTRGDLRHGRHDFVPATTARGLDATWHAGTSRRGAARRSIGERYPRYLIERHVCAFPARLDHGQGARGRARITPEDRTGTWASTSSSLDASDEGPSSRSMPSGRPSGFAPDGRSKMELLIVLAQRRQLSSSPIRKTDRRSCARRTASR